MPINFPVNPSLNDVFSVGGVSYRWNGAKWVVVTYAISGGPTGPTGPAGSTGPTGPQPDLGVVSVDVLPSSDLAFDLGASDARWRDLYLSGSSIFLGDAVLSSSDGGLSIASSSGGSVAFLTASDAASFATAAQGSLADTAVQPSDSIVVGNGGTIGSISATDAITIDSNGNVGIGTSNPNKTLTVYSATNDTEVLRIGIPGGGGGVQGKGDIGFGWFDGVAEASAAIGFEELNVASAGGELLFKTRPNGAAQSTRPSERIRITSDGYLRLASGSGGIQFGGDTAAANALDDYEEGTYTVSMLPAGGASGSITLSSNTGYYTKIGQLVIVNTQVIVSSVSSPIGSYVRMTLPFTAISASGSRGPGSLSMDPGTGWITVATGVENNKIYMAIEYDASLVNSGDVFRMTAMYFTSA